jgi:multidrug resistance efflux pump
VSAGNTVVTLRGATGKTLAVTSPINGTIINEGATPGEVVPAAQPLAQVVDLNRLIVTAYVEETHISDVHPGQGVDVTVDAIKSTTFHGSVTRILPATASTFSALPTTDYASGNFTKVTQRVPVEVTLDGYQGHTLYPGESASVTIHIHT